MLLSAVVPLVVATCSSAPKIHDPKRDVTYKGLERNGMEKFLGIHYGQDTLGENRFRPPRMIEPAPGSTIVAQSYGPACPQAYGSYVLPVLLDNVTEISEDCLTLTVSGPKGNLKNLPVTI